MNIDLIRPDALSDDLCRIWGEIQAAEPMLDSPYFRPEFTQAVAGVRRDVEIAVLSQNGQPVGFFPFQRGTLNLGKPVGGKLSDYHGIIANRDTAADPRELLRACRLAAWDFDHLVTTQAGFEPYVQRTAESPYLDFSRGYEEYIRQRNATGTDEIHQANRKARKCEREQGPLTFEIDSRDGNALRTLIRWKSAQLIESGLADIFAFPWTVSLLESILQNPAPRFSALLSVLRLGERPISILYSLRSAAVAHAWIFAYDREFARFSPGSMLLLRFGQAAVESGITKLDLGKGEERYKRCFGSGTTPLWEGTVGSASPALWLRSGWRRARDWVARSPLKTAASVPAKVLKPLREWLALH